ncbi:alpha-1,3-mannosyltransferase CMT1 [Xylariaceae sp. FL0662B]|nr:alpha-1,3-mannosyltransferase CMT1 [Xylariaceae sp. FL0662B]
MKRSRLVFLQAACLFLVTLTFWFGYNSFASESWSEGQLAGLHPNVDDPANGNVSQPVNASEPAHLSEPVNPDQPWNATLHVQAILDPTDATFPRLNCPAPNATRYGYLKAAAAAAEESGAEPRALKYFFALDLRQSIEVLPRLLGSIVEAVRFLGPHACALSIVEGNSDDGTREVVQGLRPALRRLGLAYHAQTSDVDPAAGARIAKLAQLRNQALSPLLSRPNADGAQAAPDANTTVVFLNDVALCVEDILELVHQRVFQAADMTCAMDWTYVGRDPTFYDVWVARTLRGDLFFDIPPDGSWDSAWNLFWNDAGTKQRYSRTLPFQVFACWNGAVAFGAAPVLGDAGGGKGRRIEFRSSREGECYVGEPTLFCKDLWWAGQVRKSITTNPPKLHIKYSSLKVYSHILSTNK